MRWGSLLGRRYGHAGSKGSGPRVVHRMATGGLVWAVPDTSMQIMWAGPGGRLKIGWPMKAGGSVTAIDHPSADGNYLTAREATAAVRAFLDSK
jgi:hypothetical protein